MQELKFYTQQDFICDLICKYEVEPIKLNNSRNVTVVESAQFMDILLVPTRLLNVHLLLFTDPKLKA